MKLLLLIFIIYINNSLCDVPFQNVSKKIVKSFPKKVRQGFLQYHEAGKYVMPLEKKAADTKDYTTFAKPYPVAKHVDHQIIPDSPYFPVDTAPAPEEKRARVKRVLPSYTITLLRNKRSADGKNKSIKKTVKTRFTDAGSAIRPKTKGGRNENAAKKVKATKTPGKANTKKKQIVEPANKNRTPGNQNKKHGGQQKPKYSALGSRAKAVKSKIKDLTKKKIKRIAQPRQGPKKQKQSQNRNRNYKHKPLGSRADRARRLIAGRDALIEQYPYVVSIQKDKQHWCSGALLNPTLVITTANCLWKAKMVSRMRVRAGSRHIDRDGQVARIQEVMKHPGWKIRRNPDNDVAFIVLDRKIRFSNSVHGVDLPNRVMLPAFDDVWVTSWGSDRRDGIYDIKDVSLQAYYSRLMDHGKCNNITQRFGVSVTENFFCLAQTGRRAPCTRDTGAPAVSDGVVWGLASWGIRKFCGTERYPAMFSYLASQSNMDFIVNATYYLMSDERHNPFPDRFPVPKGSFTPPTTMTMPYK